ncbi:unnamed protein product, partial [Polarella glacialis]
AMADAAEVKPIVLKAPKWGAIDGLNPDSKHVNLKLKCVSCKATEGDGPKMWEVVVGDESGVVTLQLRNEALVEICKEGASLRLQNAKVIMIKGYVRLIVDKWAVLKPLDEELSFTVGTKDASAIEYELV